MSEALPDFTAATLVLRQKRNCVMGAGILMISLRQESTMKMVPLKAFSGCRRPPAG